MSDIAGVIDCARSPSTYGLSVDHHAPDSPPRTFKTTYTDIYSRRAKPPHGIMELSGFRVSIHSDGEELKGYSVEASPDGKKAVCWVPSQSGKVRHSNAGQWSMKLRHCEGVRGEV
jgi:hypothetical protein